MGKEIILCDICGNDVKAGDGKLKAKDGIICRSCYVKSGIVKLFGAIGNVPISELRVGYDKYKAELDKNINKGLIKLDAMEQFNMSRVLVDCVYIDDTRREFYICKDWKITPDSVAQVRNNNPEFAGLNWPTIYSMDGISDVWSNTHYSENVVDTTVKEGGIGRAVVGGIIAGPAGAVVGATTRKEVATSEVRISQSGTVTWIQKDCNGIEQTFTEDLKDEKLAKSVENVIKSFIAPNNQKVNNVASETSVADEIRKFKDLLDVGAITQEEFDAKKKQLLGL